MEINEFLNKANEGFNLIPIIEEIEFFDKEAIDVYSNHFDEKKSFFFESLEGDKNWSRYTIIGCSSGDFIEIYGDIIHKFSDFSFSSFKSFVFTAINSSSLIFSFSSFRVLNLKTKTNKPTITIRANV